MREFSLTVMKLKFTLRTRFKKDIVAEFVPPTRKSNKVMIFASGMPSVPSRKELMYTFAKKGYWVFFPRYRGSWESGGVFLEKSPHEDILDVIDQIPKGFTSIWDKKEYKVTPSTIHIIGSSFGGPAALLAARDPRVEKVIAVSPVVDWCAPSKAEPMDWLYGFTKDAFGNGYRISKKNWNKMQNGTFYSPLAHTKEIPGEKVFIIHAQDDESVGWRPVEKFAKKINCKLLLLKRGGHLGIGDMMKKSSARKKIETFLKTRQKQGR